MSRPFRAHRLAVLAALLATASPAALSAQVNLRNGNYYVSYADIIAPDLAVERTYNSLSVHRSMFGVGWGWVFDTYLVPLGDGGMTIRHWGGGGTTDFAPVFPDRAATGAMVDALVRARTGEGWLASPDERAAYRADLWRRASLRAAHWERQLRDGGVEPPDPPVGRRWTAGGNATLDRVAEGYVYHVDGDETMRFDKDGRLTWVRTERGGHSVFSDGDGRIRRIAGEAGSVALLSYPAGSDFVERVHVRTAEGAEWTAAYRHDQAGNLIESVDAGANRYRYAYDALHNMTRVDYEDGGVRVITYDPSSNFTTRLQDRDGSERAYEYFGDDLHYGTREIRTSATGDRSESVYEWEFHQSADGRRPLRRTVVETEGIRSERFFRDDGELVRLERRRGGEAALLSSFVYAGGGRLERAEHADGRVARFSRDVDGSIKRIELGSDVLVLHRKGDGSVSEIELVGVARINAVAAENGHLRPIPDPPGKAARRIAELLRAVRELVAPSGADAEI